MKGFNMSRKNRFMLFADTEKSLHGACLFNSHTVTTSFKDGEKSVYYSFSGKGELNKQKGKILIQTKNPYNIDGDAEGCSIYFLFSHSTKRIKLNDKLTISDYRFLQSQVLEYIYHNNIKELKPHFEYFDGDRIFNGKEYKRDGDKANIFCTFGYNTELFYCYERDDNGQTLSTFSNEYELTGRGQALELLVSTFILNRENLFEKMRKYILSQVEKANKNYFENNACIAQ